MIKYVPFSFVLVFNTLEKIFNNPKFYFNDTLGESGDAMNSQNIMYKVPTFF